MIGSVNTQNGDITLLATDPTASLTVAGSASPSTFGIQNTTVVPGNGAVIGSDVSTFTSQSIDGGSVTAYDSDGNPLNVQLRWAQVNTTDGESTWNLYYQTNSSATGTQAVWQNVGTNFIFNSSGELIQPTTSALTLPSLTINGDTLPQRRDQFRHQRTDAIRQYKRHVAGHRDSAERLCRGLAGIGLGRHPEPRGRLVFQRPDHSAGRDYARAIQRRGFAAGAQRRRLRGHAGIGQPDLRGDRPDRGQLAGERRTSISQPSSVNLIVAQQAYSANARVMSTADQMIQSLLQVIQ